MFIIFIAHCRGNVLWDYIPARFGISDAANMFVFVSGMTAAIAFGGTFLSRGWPIGALRILYRCMQLYAAQLGMFFVTAMVVAAGTRIFARHRLRRAGAIAALLRRPRGALIGLFTLTYVPHYLDILPLYIVVLAMVPVAMALARVSHWLVLAASLALYAGAWAFQLNFPANADDQAMWFFDPFAWQLIFFTGFALRRGWIKVPLDSPDSVLGQRRGAAGRARDLAARGVRARAGDRRAAPLDRRSQRQDLSWTRCNTSISSPRPMSRWCCSRAASRSC